MSDPVKVNVTNFARAESDRMFLAILRDSGQVNVWGHNREPTPIEHQPVIRQNRDTLYSAAVVDIRDGATLSVPEVGDRYASAMVVDQDHYINRIFHAPGDHELTPAEFDTPYVLVAARILVDPDDPADVAEVNRLQDRFVIRAGSAEPFEPPEYDTASLDSTRAALLELAKGMGGFSNAFGRREEVDPVAHLIATAAGWGGLPDGEAVYHQIAAGLPVGEYRVRFRDVPVDAFWSVSVYNGDGYFEKNDLDAYSINSVVAARESDDSVVVHFGGCGDGRSNCLPIMDGWNVLLRLYRPRREVLDGSWSYPSVEPVRA